jgi:hypothetical protein
MFQIVDLCKASWVEQGIRESSLFKEKGSSLDLGAKKYGTGPLPFVFTEFNVSSLFSGLMGKGDG